MSTGWVKVKGERLKWLCSCHTCVVWRAQTGVVAHPVHAGGAILTAVVLAVVHVDFAEGSVEAEGARTAAPTNKQTTKQLMLTLMK